MRIYYVSFVDLYLLDITMLLIWLVKFGLLLSLDLSAFGYVLRGREGGGLCDYCHGKYTIFESVTCEQFLVGSTQESSIRGSCV